MSAVDEWMDHQEEAWERARDHHLTNTPACEDCGAPGELVGDTVLCPRHAEERP